MQVPLTITVRGFEHSDALDAHIREKAAKLEEFFRPIMGCRVVVEVPHRHKHQGHSFNVRLDVTVSGHEFVFNHERAEDVYVALRETFGAAKRGLEDFARRRRGEIKNHAEPARQAPGETQTGEGPPPE